MNINITLSPILKAHLESQIAAGASASVTDYVLRLVEQDYQRQQAQQKLNMLLQEGFESPSQAVTLSYWHDLQTSVLEND